MKRVAELDEITNERDNFRQAYEDLRKQRLNEFMAGFNVITNKLKENYQMLTMGGDAELELVDSLDPFSEGIMFRWVLPVTFSAQAILKDWSFMTQYGTIIKCLQDTLCCRSKTGILLHCPGITVQHGGFAFL